LSKTIDGLKLLVIVGGSACAKACLGQPQVRPAAFEEAYLRFAPLLGAAVQPDVRIGPPGITSQPESPSMIEQFLMWLQQCISPPIG
jgi:hypothetical protein